jgi:sporulation protein YlmC with PRC-barrel domain
MASTNQDVLSLRGQDLYGSDGEKLGTIEEIYLDTDTDQPEWALIATGMFGTKQSFVPLSGLSQDGDTATVPYDKATVKDAPKVDPDGRLSEEEERRPRPRRSRHGRPRRQRAHDR